MAKRIYDYVIVGGGLAGASAVTGIRERDSAGSILLIGEERHLPYDRPPLSKKLWLGKKKVEDIFIHGREFYDDNAVTLALGMKVAKIEPGDKTLIIANGERHGFGKLLLATGCAP